MYVFGELWLYYSHGILRLHASPSHPGVPSARSGKWLSDLNYHDTDTIYQGPPDLIACAVLSTNSLECTAICRPHCWGSDLIWMQLSCISIMLTLVHVNIATQMDLATHLNILPHEFGHEGLVIPTVLCIEKMWFVFFIRLCLFDLKN